MIYTILLIVAHSVSKAYGGTLATRYDEAGRLTTATFAGSKSIAYTYDPAGSLLQRQISTGSNPDTDGDGMDDVWEVIYFGSKEARDGTLDFDNDGFLDLSEFLAGTNWTDVPGDVTATGATSSKTDNIITGITARYYRVRLLP